ncbi:hypothetical protein [Actinoplanes sp. L3-i22]|uniref:hypothetical protein n=1 Tax=Actinoplanes sp. L3-i22 TaxID=2836373 RepID=UPI001C7708AB|nr:hypothetical protein [Actinoplanes sp. L3-i22]BCY13428.1 hypothetical protein L3i22_085160 [Actinoplanes sp. L3-i22]
MTRPDGPPDDRTQPADPWATINRPIPTVYLGNPDSTVSLSGSDRTARLPTPNPDSTVSFNGPDRTAPNPDSTVVFNGPDRTTPTPAPDPGPQVSPVDEAPTMRAAGELRFGPGVPVAPQPTPAWPAATPAGRPRPVWRRLVSVLSSLLTLALVVVVGFYLWQRLRPLEVESVAVAVPQPAGNRCNVTVDVVATVHTNGRSGVLRYQWFRSDSAPGAVLTEQIGSGQRAATLTLRWTFNGTGKTTETATVNIIDPSPIQAGTKVTYNCRQG